MKNKNQNHWLCKCMTVILLTGIGWSLGMPTEANAQLRRQKKGGFTYNDPNLKKAPEIDPQPYYEQKVWKADGGDSLRYRILLPENYDSTKAYPLVLFLHGAGERGSDNKKQLIHGARLFVLNRAKFPAIVVFPQCPVNGFWSNVDIKLERGADSTIKPAFNFKEDGNPTKALDRVLQWLPELEKTYLIKPDQRYVMGLSMGGMGAFEMVRRLPDYFAAAVPICGGANPNTADAIRKTAFWVFHGQMDDVVPFKYSENLVLALETIYAREEVIFTMYPQATHNSWDLAFAEPDLLSWLFKQKKK